MAVRQLSWTHYRALITVADEEKRLELLDRAVKSDWTAEALEAEVRKTNARLRESSSSHLRKSIELLTPRKGVPYTYRLIQTEKIHTRTVQSKSTDAEVLAHKARVHPGKPELKIDLGFSSFKEALMRGRTALKAGDIAESIWVKGDTYRLEKAKGKTESDLFTYYAEIERVVDGDTIIAQVDLGFGVTTRQYLRLRGIDSPELDTARGKQAKHFAESELKSVPYVIITSIKSDKYDRYLADIFYIKTGKEQFLNNQLLTRGLALRV